MTTIHTRWVGDPFDGQQEVYSCPTTVGCPENAPHGSLDLLGWIESGRDMVTVEKGQTVTWTEWAFTPAASDVPTSPVRRNRLTAREDARLYAQTLTS